MTLTEAACIAGVDKSVLKRAAKSGTLRTEASVRGYVTTPEWLDQWQANKRRGRPPKKAA